MRYAQVILPLPLADAFTYILPEGMDATQGCRVIVPFGPRHFYTGVVESVTTIAPPKGVALKEITSVLDSDPVVRPSQIRFWHWMADYYLCSVGEVYKAALPAGLKIESETRVDISPDAEPEDFAACTPEEIKILDFVKRAGSTPSDTLRTKTDAKAAAITRLVDRGLLCISEKLVERYRAVKREYVRPTIKPEGIPQAFETVKRSKKQEEALTALIALSGLYKSDTPLAEVPLEILMERADVSRPIIKALADKKLCELYKKEISRFSSTSEATAQLPVLADAQKLALKEIHAAFREKDVVLLHGVTGSGKTEIYIHLIDFVLSQGRQALFLVPEIALTTQLTRRLQRVFGSKVIIYHSKFSDNERADQWKRLASTSEPFVVIGARSAVFLPFARLGMVIVDEEHESSYKQYDPTPTVETYYKASSGKFGLVTLSERYGNASLPALEIVDMRAERGRKAVSGYFSHTLLDATLNALGRKKQAILFHNRRGYAPLARCKMCAYTPKCDHCDVSLTYHRRTNRLICHYCGTEYPVPTICPVCHEPSIEVMGYGTERLEEEIEQNFRDRRVLRMDLDTTRNKDSYSRIIDDFSAHRADILVGTQMVTKGLDFGDVELVGVLNADSLINFPDFRAAERAFNMIEQIAGRAGRRDSNGKVLVQTYNPDHPILELVQRHDYTGFYNRELEERRSFGFPPFTRIINIYVKHREARTADECATKFAASLREIFGSRISNPQEPPVGRVQSMYIRKIMLKVEREASMAKVKGILRNKFIELSASPLMRGLTVYYDVDPV